MRNLQAGEGLLDALSWWLVASSLLPMHSGVLTMLHSSASGGRTHGGHGGPAGRIGARAGCRAAAAPGARRRRCLAAGVRCQPIACTMCCFLHASLLVHKDLQLAQTCIMKMYCEVVTAHGINACQALRLSGDMGRTSGSHMRVINGLPSASPQARRAAPNGRSSGRACCRRQPRGWTPTARTAGAWALGWPPPRTPPPRR